MWLDEFKSEIMTAPGKDQEDRSGRIETKNTTCYMCACRCGIRVTLRDGQVRYIEGNPDHPLNKGVICAKGASGIMKQYSPARLTKPLKRKEGAERGDNAFESISWDEAFAIMEKRLGKIRATDPKKFALFTGRDQMQALTGLFAKQFGTPNYAAHGGFCSVNMAAGMIYACIKFLKEWASPLTVINYTLLGTASGFLLAAALAAMMAPALVQFYVVWTIIITLSGLVTRTASLIRNARLKPQSNLKTAIGIRHGKIQQRSQGQMGGSFNTREFFHGAPDWFFRNIKWLFLVLVFIVPVLLISLTMGNSGFVILVVAFVIQYIGLIAERWFFFAQANHPQNLYYQTVG